MLKRKQVITIVSIAVVSFLFGIALNTITMAINGNPFDEIWNTISELQSKVEALESQTLPQGFVSTPAYDSGWVSLPYGYPGVSLQHDLGTRELFVYFIGRGRSPEYSIHQYKYGWDNANTRKTGAFWFNLTETSIHVWRGYDDDTGSVYHNWDEARVMIWRIQEPT